MHQVASHNLCLLIIIDVGEEAARRLIGRRAIVIRRLFRSATHRRHRHGHHRVRSIGLLASRPCTTDNNSHGGWPIHTHANGTRRTGFCSPFFFGFDARLIVRCDDLLILSHQDLYYIWVTYWWRHLRSCHTPLISIYVSDFLNWSREYSIFIPVSVIVNENSSW